jgi:myo-inositol-1(or 4)-monophosphatase
MDATSALELALAAGRAAAALLRDAAGNAGAVRHKSGLDTDWVTEWDERSEALIVERLRAGAPGTRILGEEGGAQGDAASAGGPEPAPPVGGDERQRVPVVGRWLVDPVDGTVNFAHGLPLYGVSIAYEEAGQVLAGVVLAPSLGWEFAAARGQGATMNGERLAVSRVAHLRQAMLTTGFPADRLTSPQNNYKQWEHFQNVAGAVRRLGSASLDLCMVARGWFDGYWEFRLKPWDLAAGALVVEEAGGRISGPYGEPWSVDAGEIVASNGRIHEQIVDELRGLR